MKTKNWVSVLWPNFNTAKPNIAVVMVNLWAKDCIYPCGLARWIDHWQQCILCSNESTFITDPSNDCKEGETPTEQQLCCRLCWRCRTSDTGRIECGVLEVKQENSCRPLMAHITWCSISTVETIIGEHVHLIPSFDGDGPDEWMVIPSLPQGCIEQRHREINGTITSILAHKVSVVASNGRTTQTNLTFHVHYIPTGI